MARLKDDSFGQSATEPRSDDTPQPPSKIDAERLAGWMREHRQHIIRFLARILASAIARSDRQQNGDAST